MFLRVGSKGALVRELQSTLTELGFDTGLVDGTFGDKTRKAVVRFQENRGIEANGIADIALLHALGIEVKPVVPEIERTKFRELLLANPNHFGNLKRSKFEAVKPKKNDQSYESLKCVGYHPHLEQLEAVVHIRRDYGFGGDICSNGTPEYVRFFVDWDNDGHWEDLGMSYFTAYDLPGDKPLEYAVTLDVDAKEKVCSIENLPMVKAILSWNDPPPTGEPNFEPVWGNALVARIQIGASKHLVLAELLKLAKGELPASVIDNLDLSQAVSLAQAKAMSTTELGHTYKDQGVPAHRYAFSKLQKLLVQPTTATAANAELVQAFEGLGIKTGDVVEALTSTDGDIRYEELKCIGYDSQRRLLVGVITLKLPNGYSGDLCKEGSTEYVAFWEWDEIEATWVYVGTTAVLVHDLKGLPNDGLQYAVSLSAPFAHRRIPCTTGPSQARIRAILSWEVAPPPHDPNWVPKWGNREETHIHIRPGPKSTGLQTPFVETVGNVHVCAIDQTTGLASGEGMIAAFDADRSPFGGTVTITGYIDNPPGGVMEGMTLPLRYQVVVRPYDPIAPRAWQALNNDFAVWVREELGASPPVHRRIVQAVDPTDGYYTYLEDSGAPHERHYVLPVLAKWNTGRDDTGLWEIGINAKAPGAGPGGPFYNGGVLLCAADGSMRSVVKVRLDNKAPRPSIGLTGYQRGADPTVHPIGTGTPEKCGKFQKHDVLHGTYSVTDEHFGVLTLRVRPDGPAHGAIVNPPERHFDIVATTGESGTWTLATGSMEPCGYIVELWARDRTIVDSGSIGWRDSDDVGFCLEVQEEG